MASKNMKALLKATEEIEATGAQVQELQEQLATLHTEMVAKQKALGQAQALVLAELQQETGFSRGVAITNPNLGDEPHYVVDLAFNPTHEGPKAVMRVCETPEQAAVGAHTNVVLIEDCELYTE